MGQEELSAMLSRIETLEASHADLKRQNAEIIGKLNELLNILSGAKGVLAVAKIGGWIVGIGAAIATAYYTMRLSIHK